MNLNEVQRLIEHVQAFCPAQMFTEATKDVWAEELSPFASEVVQEAARGMLRAARDDTDRPRYLHLGDLLAEARGLARRSTATMKLPPPPPSAATPEARERWEKDATQVRNTGNVEAFLRKWYGTTTLAAITEGREGE